MTESKPPHQPTTCPRCTGGVDREVELKNAGNTLAAYVYSTMNPGSIPEQIRTAMQVFEKAESVGIRNQWWGL